MLVSGPEALREYHRRRSSGERRRRAIGPHDDNRHPHMSSLHDPWQDGGIASPKQLPGIVDWWDSSLGVTQSGTVTAWVDQISGLTLAPGTAPTYNASDANFEADTK